MARSHHDAAVRPKMTRREVDHLGTAQSNVYDLDTRFDKSVDNGVRKFLARQSHVAAYDN